MKQFYGKYGDMPPWGNGPEQWRIEEEGRKYVEKNYPMIDKFKTCTVNLVNPDASDSQSFSRELLSEDMTNTAQIQNKPKPYELTLHTHDANNSTLATSQHKDLRSSLSESILMKLIGMSFLVIIVFLCSQKKKKADKRN